MSCSALVPRALHRAGGGVDAAKSTTDRLLAWSAVIGVGVAILQLEAVPMLGIFSSLQEVRQAAVAPCVIAALVQVMNAIVLCGEGIVRGHRAFDQLLWASLVAASGFLFCLQYFSTSLAGVWSCVAVATGLQMVYLLHSPFVTGKWTTKREDIVLTPGA
jgi:Na+-driven multidrug efflux pump